jgi:hypothetical protein
MFRRRFRRRLTFLLPSDQLRDYNVRLLRQVDEPLRAIDREEMARDIERHWRSDPKRDKRIARYRKADTIRQQLAELLDNDSTMTVAQARQTLARQHRHNSDTALDKWLRRNRDYPKHSFRRADINRKK